MDSAPTPEQLAKLASVVTKRHCWIENNSILVSLIRQDKSGVVYEFKPDFNGKEWQQVQALQLLVWAGKKIDNKCLTYTGRVVYRLLRILATKDTDALLAIGVELMETL